ncbi:hypothetical protein C8R46DRAFT_1186690 [Mycena filopes]|nr:hypothetical protein C8R46DRAFT_1186690 [Mycena filopes]
MDATLDVTSFSADGFSDFKLDLTCLSSPLSPPPSPPPPSDSPFSSYLPSSPPASSRRSVSFTTGPTPSLGRASSTPRLSTSPRISLTGPAASTTASSWPLSRYVGRGTPIDHKRRSEWGGNGAGGDEVGEDGVLFSTVRSTSLDSLSPLASNRSISPLAEWNYISPPLLHKSHPYPSSASVSERHRRSTVSLEPLPESAKIKLEGVDINSSAEWATSTQQVLASPVSATASTSTPELSSETHNHYESAEELLRTPEEPPTPTLPRLVPNPNPSSHTHTHPPLPLTPSANPQEADDDAPDETDLGLESLHAAVDQGLGLVPGGMTWFNVGILPGAAASAPSVYSCDNEPEPSTPRSRSRTHSLSDAGARVPLRARLRRSGAWWGRFVARLRALRAILRRHRQEE